MFQYIRLTFQNISLNDIDVDAFPQLKREAGKILFSVVHVFHKRRSLQFTIQYWSVYSSVTDINAMLKVTATLQLTLRHLIT
jgi:hypothetical protein